LKQLIQFFTSYLCIDTGQVRDQTCPGHVGLINQGATCYLNSLVQALFHIPAFKKFMFQVDSTANVVSALRFLFARMQLSEDCAVSTKALTSAFGWSNADVFEQHDAQELLVSMADAMSQESSDLDDFFTKNFKGSVTGTLFIGIALTN
jgi:ubiquitin carboxyl-terminal hydrolase 7